MKKPGMKGLFLAALMLTLWLVLPACDSLDDIDDKVDRVQNSVDQVDSRLDDLENRSEVDGPIGYETAQELEALVQERREQYGIPGMVLAIRKSGQPTWASGNLTSTAEDLLTWVTALGRGEITPNFFSQQLNFRPFVHSLEYGLGIVNDLVDPDNPFDDMIGHQGGTLGYQSVMMYLPYEDAAVVCLYNVTLPPDVKNYAEIVVYDALELAFPGR